MERKKPTLILISQTYSQPHLLAAEAGSYDAVKYSRANVNILRPG